MSFSSVLSAEYIKLRTIRLYSLMLLMGVLGLGISALGIAATATSGETVSTVALCLEYMAYMLLVLGALMSAGEFRNGIAALTSSLVPSWNSVLVAKVVVIAVVGLIVSCATLLATVIGAAVGSGTAISVVIEASGGPALVADTLAGPLAGIMGVAIGELLRNTPAAVLGPLLWALVVETILLFVLPVQIIALLPFKTIGMSRITVGELGPVAGIGVFGLYVLVCLVAAMISAKRRPVPDG